MTDDTYAVVLTDKQEVKVVQCDPDKEIFDTARELIGCDWIEIVEPETLSDKDMVFLIDEEGKLSAGTKFLNCIASHLYKTEKHGDPIIGSAVILKAGEEELKLLTKAEAETIHDQMTELRGKAIDSIAGLFGLLPEVRKKNEIRNMIQTVDALDNKRRQPCDTIETER